MAFEDSKKAAASTGWKAKRFWEKRDMTHYAHNALQQMGGERATLCASLGV